jgi:hypothetical protein
MVKFFVVGAIACLEYVVTSLFIVFIAFELAQGLDLFAPGAIDYSAEQELLEAIAEGQKSGQITPQQVGQILQIYRDNQAGRQRLRSYVLYAVSICISTAGAVFLFRKYRSLRYRERFRDYFFQAPV